MEPYSPNDLPSYLVPLTDKEKKYLKKYHGSWSIFLVTTMNPEMNREIDELDQVMARDLLQVIMRAHLESSANVIPAAVFNKYRDKWERIISDVVRERQRAQLGPAYKVKVLREGPWTTFASLVREIFCALLRVAVVCLFIYVWVSPLYMLNMTFLQDALPHLRG